MSSTSADTEVLRSVNGSTILVYGAVPRNQVCNVLENNQRSYLFSSERVPLAHTALSTSLVGREGGKNKKHKSLHRRRDATAIRNWIQRRGRDTFAQRWRPFMTVRPGGPEFHTCSLPSVRDGSVQ
jgi:hypothetical protein